MYQKRYLDDRNKHDMIHVTVKHDGMKVIMNKIFVSLLCLMYKELF